MEGKAQRLINQCKQKAKHQAFVEIPELALPDVQGSIETRTISMELQSILEELNVQANHLDEWREIMIQILISPLVDQDEDATGEEFEESVNKQSEGKSYPQTLIVYGVIHYILRLIRVCVYGGPKGCRGR